MRIGILFILLGFANIILIVKNSKRTGKRMMIGSFAVTFIIIIIGTFIVLGPK